MAHKITKNEVVFDRRKIGVGDVISFPEHEIKIFGKAVISHDRIGIVSRVELDTVWVKTQDDQYNFTLEEFGIPIDRSDEIKLIYRSYYNVGTGDMYGEIE